MNLNHSLGLSTDTKASTHFWKAIDNPKSTQNLLW